MKNLDLLDRKILYELDFDSRITIPQLAKRVRGSKETVHFRLQRLVKNNYIRGFVTTLYTSHLNLFYYKLFYKFHRTTPETDMQITSFIQHYPKTAWFGSFEGPFDIAFLIIATSVYDVEDFLIQFRKKFGEFILEQEIHTLTSVHRFNLKFFYHDKREMHTQYPKELKQFPLDAIDYFILKQLANNARLPLATLAKRLRLDTSTILYRVRNLRKKKILGTAVLVVDFEKFGVQHYQINFILKDYDACTKLIHYFSRHPHATFATTTIGKYDLAVELVAKNNIELRQILDAVKEQYSSLITSHDTFLIVKEHVVTWLPEKA